MALALAQPRDFASLGLRMIEIPWQGARQSLELPP